MTLPREDRRNDFAAHRVFGTNSLLMGELCNRGCTVRRIGRMVWATKDGQTCILNETETSFTSRVACRVLNDTDLIRLLLHKHGVTTSARGSDAGAERDRTSGDITARYLVVGGLCIAAHRVHVPQLIGDGLHTISDLLDRKNSLRRRMNPSRRNNPIEIDKNRLGLLLAQGFSLDSVPAAGQTVLLDLQAKLSAGAETEDITDTANPGFKAMAERISRIVPGIDIIGIDILATDHEVDPNAAAYHVGAVNTRPGILGHQFPDFGTSRNVCAEIAAHCVSQLAQESSFGTRHRAPGSVASGQAENEGVTLAFGGDTSLGESYLRRAAPDVLAEFCTDPFRPFEAVAPMVSGTDGLVLNLETVLAEAPGAPLHPKKNYIGCDDPGRTVKVLQRLGADAVSLANNHSLDFAEGGLESTRQALSDAGITAIGAGPDLSRAQRPFRFDTSTCTVHIIPGFEFREGYQSDYGYYAEAARPGVAPFEISRRNRLADAIAQQRRSDPGSVIIAFPHWGGANYRWAGRAKHEAAAGLLEAGADLILGHGAHMAQQVLCTEAGTTVFSLGNFVFNSPGRYHKDGAHPYSLIGRLRIAQRGQTLAASLRLYPILSDNRSTGYRPRPVTEAEALELFRLLADRSGEDFATSVGLTRDGLGWCLEPVVPLSPRLASFG